MNVLQIVFQVHVVCYMHINVCVFVALYMVSVNDEFIIPVSTFPYIWKQNVWCLLGIGAS